MKKKFFAFLLGLLILPFAFLLSACGTIRIAPYFPDEYEASLTSRSTSDTTLIKEWNVIHTTIDVDGTATLVHYVKHRTYNSSQNPNDVTWESYLGVWNTSGEIGYYQAYTLNENQWESNEENSDAQRYFNSITSAFTYKALYGIGVSVKSSDIQEKNEEYVEYKWGGSNPDTLRFSNNKYEICLYHLSPSSLDEFTKFEYAVTSTIPYIDTLHFAD